MCVDADHRCLINTDITPYQHRPHLIIFSASNNIVIDNLPWGLRY